MQTAAEKVREIHRAVDFSVDNLLMDSPYDPKAIEALKMLGFTSAENVEEAKDHQTHREYARKYRQAYPHYKFITEFQLTKIADKYKLSTQGLDRFKGAIPQKNITDMLNFKIHKNNIAQYNERRDPLSFINDDFMDAMTRALGIPDQISGSGFSKRYKEEVLPQSRSIFVNEASTIRDYVPAHPLDRERHEFERAREAARMLQDMDRPDRLMTFAEINQMFPASVKITAEKGLFKAPDPDLDPIVTVAVHGGYLVVTAWGAEAADPEIINPISN